MTHPNLDALLAKLRALRAKANDSATTEAEAALYAAKVAELLQKHNLEESALSVDEQESVDPNAAEYEGDYMRDPWRCDICFAIGRLYFCGGYRNLGYERFDPKKHGDARKYRDYDGLLQRLDVHGRWDFVERVTYRWTGRPHNAVVAREMSDYLIKTCVRLGRDYKREIACSHSESVNFMRGCADRIVERVNTLYWKQSQGKKQRADNGNPGNLPALYEDENALIKAAQENLRLKNMRGSTAKDTEATAAGRRAGDSVSLNTQIGTTRAAGRLLQ